MILLAMLLQTTDAAAMVATADTRLSVEHRCVASSTTDITVCGMRDADRFRVPFTDDDPNARDHEGVWQQTARLLHRTSPLEDHSIFLVGGGYAGVTVSTLSGVQTMKDRPLAP